MSRVFPSLCALALAAGVSGASIAQPPPARPTPEDAARVVAAAEERLRALGIEANRAGWVQANFITEDTEALSALAAARLIRAPAALAKEAER